MAAAGPVALPAGLHEVDGPWLSAALGIEGVDRVAAEPLGAGHMADTFLLTLTGAPWAQLVLKLTAVDEGSRATAARHRSYEVEVGFYRDLAADLEMRIPACRWLGYDADSGRCALLLEHVGATQAGDQVSGCAPAVAAGALAELALLHAAHWGDESLVRLAWLDRYADGYRAANSQRVRDGLDEFVARYASQLSPDVTALAVRFADGIAGYDRRGQRGPRTVGHGDFRLDNLLLGGERVCVVDWQTAFLGHGLVDVSYFLGGSLSVEDRRAHEETLVRDYHARLVDRGVALSWAACWLAYRRYALEGLGTVLFAAPTVKRSERGDALFVAMAERAGRHALDVESEQLLEL